MGTHAKLTCHGGLRDAHRIVHVPLQFVADHVGRTLFAIFLQGNPILIFPIRFFFAAGDGSGGTVERCAVIVGGSSSNNGVCENGVCENVRGERETHNNNNTIDCRNGPVKAKQGV